MRRAYGIFPPLDWEIEAPFFWTVLREWSPSGIEELWTMLSEGVGVNGVGKREVEVGLKSSATGQGPRKVTWSYCGFHRRVHPSTDQHPQPTT